MPVTFRPQSLGIENVLKAAMQQSIGGRFGENELVLKQCVLLLSLQEVAALNLFLSLLAFLHTISLWPKKKQGEDRGNASVRVRSHHF